ncbi:unnamed protein product [Cladocopium goreaui]|uniref:REJ domain-containing protein n=1 Tax=Cladocopium goreaui TaxID=2562237 RepID=A0A9P1D7L3_9DINO|nr:unnamed protein product [Cladocopium goreaui]
MLRGKLPFSAETQDATLERTVKCDVSYSAKPFAEVSQGVIDLMKATINRHVDARPSAFECFYKVYSMASPEVRTELENRRARRLSNLALARLALLRTELVRTERKALLRKALLRKALARTALLRTALLRKALLRKALARTELVRMAMALVRTVCSRAAWRNQFACAAHFCIRYGSSIWITAFTDFTDISDLRCVSNIPGITASLSSGVRADRGSD